MTHPTVAETFLSIADSIIHGEVLRLWKVQESKYGKSAYAMSDVSLRLHEFASEMLGADYDLIERAKFTAISQPRQ